MRKRLLTRGTFSTNSVANLFGRLLPGVLTVAVVPLLLPLVGREGYGVLGLYTTFQIVFATLEVGLTITATRQIARNRALETAEHENRNLLRVLECVYWLTGAVVAVLIAVGAGWIADQLNTEAISHVQVAEAIGVGGIAIALRWPIALYAGILDGLQFQVTQNVVTVGAALLRIIGALPFVAWVDTSVVGFMLWQVIASVVELGAMGFLAWWSLGGQTLRARFDLLILQRLWRLAAGLTLVGVLGALLTQVDRFVIGTQLPLADLGYYTLAMTAAGPLPLIAAAIAGAALPRFSGALARKEDDAVAATYRRAFDITAYVAVWGALPLIFFSHEILLLWTRSDAVADAADRVLTLLSVAYLLNALYTIPYTLVLAAGRTRIPMLVNMISLPVVAAVTYALVPSIGLVGAAAIWLGVMGVHLVVYGVWVHRTLLPGSFVASLAKPALFCAHGALIFGAARLASSVEGNDNLWIPTALAAAAVTAFLGLRQLPLDLKAELGATFTPEPTPDRARVVPSGLADAIRSPAPEEKASASVVADRPVD